MKSGRFLSLMVVVSIIFLLVSCWIPEDFEASVTVNQDGSYTFTYDGTITFSLALAAAKEGSLTQKDEAEFEEVADELRQDPSYKEVKYLGKGRYRVFVEKSGKPGEQYYFMSKRENKFFSIEPQQNGAIKISSVRFSKKTLNELKSIGAKVNGTLAVSVERGVKVIKHNAQSEPKLFGFFGTYEWEIKSVDAEPVIIVQPSA